MKHLKTYEQLNEGYITFTLAMYFLLLFFEGIYKHIRYDNNKDAEKYMKMFKVLINYLKNDKEKLNIKKTDNDIKIKVDNKDRYDIILNDREIIFKSKHYNILLKRDIDYHLNLNLETGDVEYTKNGETTYNSTITPRIMVKLKKLIDKIYGAEI